MWKGAEAEGHKPKPSSSHPQVGGEDVVLRGWGLLVTNVRGVSSVMTSGRKLAQLLTVLLDAGNPPTSPQSYPS